MIKHETAFDLFQRLNVKDERRYQSMIDRLNKYHRIFFPTNIKNKGQLIELLDRNRTLTKTFLHNFISDYIEYMKYRNEMLLLSFKSDEVSTSSPRANKNSNQSVKSTLQMKQNYNESIMFLYIDTEYKECPFQSEYILWYDCETSTQLISTLLLFEQSYFIPNPDRQLILIIDSSTQVPLNDYCHASTATHVMSVDENKRLTIQWHTILCHLVIKYRLSCILIEHLDTHMPMFDTIISKRDEKLVKQISKQHHELQIPFSEFAFGRLMHSEHYANSWDAKLEYRQLSTNDLIDFYYDLKLSSNRLSLFNDEPINDKIEKILASIMDHRLS